MWKAGMTIRPRSRSAARGRLRRCARRSRRWHGEAARFRPGGGARVWRRGRCRPVRRLWPRSAERGRGRRPRYRSPDSRRRRLPLRLGSQHDDRDTELSATRARPTRCRPQNQRLRLDLQVELELVLAVGGISGAEVAAEATQRNASPFRVRSAARWRPDRCGRFQALSERACDRSARADPRS